MKKEKELKDLENTEDVEGGVSLNKHPICPMKPVGNLYPGCDMKPVGNISHPLCDVKPRPTIGRIKSRSIKGKF